MPASRFTELYMVSCDERSLEKEQNKFQYQHVLIEYCLSGSGTLRIGGKTFPLEAGNCFVIFANTPFTLTSAEPSAWRSIYAEVAGSRLAPLLPQIGASETSPILPWSGDHHMQRHFTLLYRNRVCTRLPDHMGVISVLFGLIGGMIILNVNPDSRRPLEQEGDPIASIISYIKNNYSKNLTVTELAERLHFSRSYFSTLFRQKTGMSPQQFLVRHRLWLACSKLRHESFNNITQIANSVGYEVQIFTQAFRRTLGISPSEYRTLPPDEQKSLANSLGIEALMG